MGVSRDGGGQVDCGTNLADILSSALPPTPHDKSKEKSSDSSVSKNSTKTFRLYKYSKDRRLLNRNCRLYTCYNIKDKLMLVWDNRKRSLLFVLEWKWRSI